MGNYGGCCGNGRNPMARAAVFGGALSPAASFTTSPSPATGAAPLTVAFTDTSTNSPTSWLWTIVGGTVNVDYVYTVGSATSQNPTIRFDTPVVYSITLTATNASGSGVSSATAITAQMNATLQIWYDTLIVKPSNALLLDLNTLMNGLQSDGDLIEMDLFHPIAGLETDEQRLRPIKSTSGADFSNVNAVTLAAGGATGNGTTSYIDLNWKPLSHGVKYTRDSACIGLYSRTNANNGGIEIGETDGVGKFIYLDLRDGGVFYSSINDILGDSVAVADSLALFATLRTASTTTSSWKRGVSIDTGTSASTALADLDLYICARNVNSVAANFGIRQVSFPYAGSGIVNQLDVYNRIQTYMTSRGINV